MKYLVIMKEYEKNTYEEEFEIINVQSSTESCKSIGYL